MKKILPLLLGFAALLALGAADAPTVSESLVRIQTDPASGSVQAFFEKTVTLPDGSSFKQPWTQTSWALASSSPVTITLADGTTAQTTRAAVFAAVQAIAQEEHASPSAPPANP